MKLSDLLKQIPDKPIAPAKPAPIIGKHKPMRMPTIYFSNAPTINLTKGMTKLHITFDDKRAVGFKEIASRISVGQQFIFRTKSGGAIVVCTKLLKRKQQLAVEIVKLIGKDSAQT